MFEQLHDLVVKAKALVPIAYIVNISNGVKVYFVWLGWDIVFDQLIKNNSPMVNLAGFLGVLSATCTVLSALVALFALLTGNYPSNNLK